MYLVPYLFTFLRIGPLRFQARNRKKRPKPGFSFVCLFYVVVYFVTDAWLALVVIDLFFLY